MALMQLHFYSETLQCESEAWVVLPHHSAFTEPGKKFKVLWYMHGGCSDYSSWIRTTRIEEVALKHDIAVIMPGALRSCFTDMHMGAPYCRYIGWELPQIMRRLLPFLSDKREDNFVSGFSNGGYGAYLIGLTYPDTFGAIAPFAAGDKADVANWDERPWAVKVPVYGPGDLHGTKYSIHHLADRLVSEGGPFPRIFHCCGEFDPFKVMNESLRDHLSALEGDPFCYRYTEIPGEAHSTACCEKAMDRFLDDYLAIPQADLRARR